MPTDVPRIPRLRRLFAGLVLAAAVPLLHAASRPDTGVTRFVIEDA